jgi:hypothetical protein
LICPVYVGVVPAGGGSGGVPGAVAAAGSARYAARFRASVEVISGKRGMPSSPSRIASRMSDAERWTMFGPRDVPRASTPWQDAQLVANVAAPASA